MGLFIAFIIGTLVYSGIIENTKNSTKNDQVEVIIEANANKVVKQKASILDNKPKLKEPVITKEKVKTELKEPVTTKEKVKTELKEPVITKEEVKTELKESVITKEEVKPELKEIDSTEEVVKETDSLDVQNKSWLKIALYILGPILLIITGKYFYSKLRNNSPSRSSSDYMRREFKEEAQPETTDQQSTQEEAQPETTEQQSTQEEAQPETTEQQSTQEEDDTNK